jgi:hypothetical protein
MGLRGVTAIALLFSLPVACGGRVIEEQTPDETTTPNEMTSQDASSPPKKASAAGSSKNDPNGSVSLPECVPGTLATKLDPSSLPMTCPYIYAGRCYGTKVKACACACPNKAGTVCSSGFPSFEGTTAVSCS